MTTTKRRNHGSSPYSGGQVNPYTHGTASAAEIACEMACVPLDRIATEMDQTWGVGRLPGLVAPDMAARYGKAMAALEAAVRAGNIEDTTQTAANCIKGLAALDAAARAAGHQPAAPTAWVYECEGLRFGVIRETYDWLAAREMYPDLRIYTLSEIATLLMGPITAANAVKAAFPGATVSEVRPRTERFHEDSQIPF